jgi:hypothetical protein
LKNLQKLNEPSTSLKLDKSNGAELEIQALDKKAYEENLVNIINVNTH